MVPKLKDTLEANGARALVLGLENSSKGGREDERAAIADEIASCFDGDGDLSPACVCPGSRAGHLLELCLRYSTVPLYLLTRSWLVAVALAI